MGTGISFAIPAYKRTEKALALAKVLAGQISASDEVLICEDGSTPESMGAFEKGGGAFRYLPSVERLGMVGNWNRCLTAAAQEWVCIIHDDDHVTADAVAAMRRAIGLLSGPGMISHAAAGDAAPGDFRAQYRAAGRWSVLNALLLPSGAIVHKEVVAKVGLFDAKFGYSPDIEYFARVCAAFPAVLIQSPVVVTWNLHEANHEYETWRKPDFFEQLEAIERSRAALAGLSGAEAEGFVTTQMHHYMVHILCSTARIRDWGVVKDVANRLLKHPRTDGRLRAKCMVYKSRALVGV